MTPAARLELAGALKRSVEDVNIRIPASTAVRQDLHAVRRAAEPTGAPRLVATEDTNGHADTGAYAHSYANQHADSRRRRDNPRAQSGNGH